MNNEEQSPDPVPRLINMGAHTLVGQSGEAIFNDNNPGYTPKHAVESVDFADKQSSIIDREQQLEADMKDYAEWQMNIGTTRITKEDLAVTVLPKGGGVKASENGLTTDDFAYQATLKDMVEDHGAAKGQSRKQKLAQDKAELAKEHKRNNARLTMQFKTGDTADMTQSEIEYAMYLIEGDEQKAAVQTKARTQREARQSSQGPSTPRKKAPIALPVESDSTTKKATQADTQGGSVN